MPLVEPVPETTTPSPLHHIEAQTSLVERPLRTLKSGDAFAVMSSYGDISAAGGTPEGLFFRDTRYLSYFELLLDGQRPLLLGSVIQDDNRIPQTPDLRLESRDAVVGVVRADAGDDVGAVAHRLQHGAYEFRFLRVAGGRGLTGGAVDDQAVVACVHQVGREPLGAVEVECAVRREGRDHGGEDPPEGGLRSRGRSHG